MRAFKFKGDWETEIKLLEFSKFLNPIFFTHSSIHNPDGTVRMIIDESRNVNPDPEDYQLKTINLLLDIDNQKKIIQSIFTYIKKVAYPDVQSRLPKKEFPDCYPNLERIDDLYNVVAIVGVNIHSFQKDEFAMYTLSFNSSFNYERSLNLTLAKTTVIDHIEWSDFPSEKIRDLLGDRSLTEEEYKVMEKEEQTKELVYHFPHHKYGKLKSWQKSENNNYPIHLLDRGNFEELKSFIISNGDGRENLKSNLLARITKLEIDIPEALEKLLST